VNEFETEEESEANNGGACRAKGFFSLAPAHTALTSPVGLGRTLKRVLVPAVLVDKEEVLSSKEKAPRPTPRAREARCAQFARLVSPRHSRFARLDPSKSHECTEHPGARLLPRPCALKLGTHVVKYVPHDDASRSVRGPSTTQLRASSSSDKECVLRTAIARSNDINLMSAPNTRGRDFCRDHAPLNSGLTL
jgi:hypothetical protein